MPSDKPTSYLSVVDGSMVTQAEDEPLVVSNNGGGGESSFARTHVRLVAAGVWLFLVLVGYMAMSFSSNTMASVQQQDWLLFADILSMEPPQEQQQDVDLEGAAPAWSDCKTKGTQIAGECMLLNPVDPEGCTDRGKEAAKACYKEMAKQYKTFWKNYGKEMKAKGKAMKVSKGDDDDDDGESSSE